MSALSRRHVLQLGGALAALPFRSLHANPLGLPIGCQLYPVGKMIAQDFPGTLRQLAKIGYQTVELCSPPAYESAGFAPLVPLTPAQLRNRFEEAGLACHSCHYTMGELRTKLEDRIAWAKDLGLSQMIVSTLGVRPDAGMADWVRAAEEFNRMAEPMRKAGIQGGFHNHNFEFREIDGMLIYDKLMSVFDPALVKMQFQVAVISLGYKASTYLRKYPDRFISMHLADWSPTTKRPVPIGSGVVDWKELFAAAKVGGVKNYFVEMNLEEMRDSYPYLKNFAA